MVIPRVVRTSDHLNHRNSASRYNGLQKLIPKQLMTQRQGLKAVTGAYEMTSTVTLQVIGGFLPLDLEVRKYCTRVCFRQLTITKKEYDNKENELLNL